MTWTAVFLQRAAFAPLAPLIQNEFGISYSELGAIPALSVLVAGVGYAIAAYTAQAYSVKRTLLVGLLGLSAFTLLIATSASYLELLAFQGAQALFEGFAYTAVVILIVRNFPSNHRGKALGITDSGISVGGFLMLVSAGSLALWLGWRAVFLISIVPAVAIGFLAWTRIREEKPLREPISALYRQLLGNRQFWMLAMLMVANLMNFFALLFFSPTYLTAVRGLNIIFAGVISGAALAATIPWHFGGGALVDKFGPRRTIIGSMMAYSAVLFVFVATSNLIVSIVALLLTFGLLIWGFIGVLVLVPIRLPPQTVNVAIGLLLAIGYSVGAIGMFALGFIADILSLETAFLSLTAVALFASITFALRK